MSLEATREIMWNIPAWMKYAMYFCLALATAALAKGLYQKYLFITQGKDWKQILPKKLNWQNFLKTIFFKNISILIIYFVSMSMSFTDYFTTIKFSDLGIRS